MISCEENVTYWNSSAVEWNYGDLVALLHIIQYLVQSVNNKWVENIAYDVIDRGAPRGNQILVL